MAIVGVGVDIEEIKRFKSADTHFIESIFDATEIEYCQQKKQSAQSFAGIFCLKEAYIKASGTKPHFKEIVVHHKPSGSPFLMVQGAPILAHCSISHSGGNAIGLVVLESLD